MKRVTLAVLHLIVGTVLLVPPTGCIVAADLFDPSFVSALGIDPITVYPRTGTIIVTFTNNTTSAAVFRAYEIGDVDNPDGNSRNFSVVVPAGEVRNEVLFCPIDVISLGTLDASYTATNDAATVYAESDTEVTYGGAELQNDSEYECGDVISVVLTEQGTDSATYSLSVQVIPGD
ncbi:MAG: hypothetical protein JXO22_11995 [Phycisphaerae bacterium]|nr:hypothetical protein [Phycisphaerae bacterium]